MQFYATFSAQAKSGQIAGLGQNWTAAANNPKTAIAQVARLSVIAPVNKNPESGSRPWFRNISATNTP
jgi:hypothetical protein